METKMDDGTDQKDKKDKKTIQKHKRQRRSTRERRQEERRQWKPKWTTAAPTSIIRLNEESCVSSDGFLGERILLPQMGRYL